jgi:hypothetical protein
VATIRPAPATNGATWRATKDPTGIADLVTGRS